MAREIGTFPISGNFEVQKAATFDARQSVDNFADLLNFTSANFIINAFPVSVKGVSTPSERGLYICNDKDNLDLAESWIKLGDGLTIAETITGIEAITIEADKLNYLSLKNRPTVYTNTDFNTDFNNKTTSDLTEGTNLYYTQTRVRAEILAGILFSEEIIFLSNSSPITGGGRVIGVDSSWVKLNATVNNALLDGTNISGSSNGRIFIFQNHSATNNVIIRHNINVGFFQKFIIPSGLDITLKPKESIFVIARGFELTVVDFLGSIVGDITALNTTNKTSLVAAINEVLAGGGGSYTDAEARAAQASLLTTGTSILFDRPRYYGYPTAVSTNITFDFTGAVSGQAQHIRVNASTKPTLPASIRLLAGGFVPDVINDYYLTPWLISSSPDVWVVHVTISQENTY